MAKNTEKNSRFGGIISIIVVVALVISGVWAVVNRDRLGSYINGLFGGGSTRSGFEFDTYDNSVYAMAGSSLTVASHGSIQLFDASGNELENEAVSINEPVAAGGESASAVWSSGGSEFWIFSEKAMKLHKDFGAAITDISLNKNGWTAVAAAESGYKGSVTVFNGDLTAIYKWYSGEGYLLKGEISPDNRSLAVLTLTGGGSKLSFFALNSENEKGSYSTASDVIIDMNFMSSSRLCALSDSRAVFVDTDGTQKGEYSYDGMHLKDYVIGTDGYTVLLLGKYLNGGAGQIVVLDSEGSVKGSLEVVREVLSISAHKRNVAVLYSDRLEIYTTVMAENSELTETSGVKRIMMRNDGMAILITGYGASLFDPG